MEGQAVRHVHAIDLGSLIRSSSEGRRLDELYGPFVELLEEHDFDPELAGAVRLGREAAESVGVQAARALREVLVDERLSANLVSDMGGVVQRVRLRLTAFTAGVAATTT